MVNHDSAREERIEDRLQNITWFDQLMNDSQTQQLLECFGLKEFKFAILTSKHKQGAIDLLSFNFSNLVESDYGIIFNDGLSYYEMIVNHVMTTGLSVIAWINTEYWLDV